MPHATKYREEEDESSHLIQKVETAPEIFSENDMPRFGARHMLALIGFLGFLNVYAMRVNLSVALVAMVNSTSKEDHSSGKECPNPHANDTKTHMGEFSWDESTQGNVLGAFFYGYIITQIPGGFLAARYGGKHILGFGILCTAVFTLLTPLAARTSVYVLVALRVLEGIGEGVTFAAMHTIWAKWAPLYERTKLVGFTYSGCWLGTVISMPITGILCDSNIAGGWPSAFYIFGAIGVAWFFLWTTLVYETPGQHPRINPNERIYIESSTRLRKNTELKVPWMQIVKSPPVWALCIANFCINWGIYVFLTCLPTYLKNIQHFDMEANGALSALPYAVFWILANVASLMADFVRKREYLSTKNTRKVFNSIGTLVPAGMVLCVGYAGCDHVLVLVFLSLCVGIGGFVQAGTGVNHIDIAPRFAGILLGLSNTFGTIPGFVSPLFVGALTNHNQTHAQWQIVFYVTAGIYVFGALAFILLADGELQSWAGVEPVTIVVPEPIADEVSEDKGKDRIL